MLTFGSLFAGIGGLDLGLERAGMSCRWQVEIDDYGRRVLAKHWPDIPKHGDIKTFPSEAEFNTAVDLICGGFPCQDISFAGKGAGLDGERSGLFYELTRVVREVGPRFVLLENVAALLVRGLDDVLGTLAEIGYNAEWHCIPAASVGAPHIRDRVFIIALADSASTGEGEVFRPGSRLSLEFGGGDRSGNPWNDEPSVGRVVDGVPARVDRLRGLGNAVVPQVAEFIGRAIMQSVQNNG
jgi:DNA (cytosine-5)-methyltransferase 1